MNSAASLSLFEPTAPAAIPPVFPTPTEHLKNLGNVKAAIRRNLRPLSSSAPGAAVIEACADSCDWRHHEACAIRDAWRPAAIFRAGPIQHARLPDEKQPEPPSVSYENIADQTAESIYRFAMSRAAKLDYLFKEGFAEDEAQQFTDIVMSKVASGEYQEKGLFDHFLSSQWRLFRFDRWHAEYEPRKKFSPITEVGTGEFDQNGEEYRVPRVELENLERFTKDGKLIPESGQVFADFDSWELRQRLAESWDKLTDLDKEVYELTAEGHNQEQAAEKLCVDVRTVRRRLESMKERVQAQAVSA